ncbi:TonB-dependent receptor [Emcibacter sp.]|uniref:TonB-dependent receptor n=1 Tax=Emcibacter sp. TaxID=1979954 RepID=UPI003A8D5D2C
MSVTTKRNNVLLSVSGIALAAALATTAGAEEAYVDSNGKELEEVVTWGTQVRSNSLYLGEQEIALKQADHLSDLLRQLPGVEIGGTHSVNSRINIRGLDDRRLNVYIDGALQTNYLYHHMGNLLINPDILKSADLQLGATSVIDGGQGGAVRFVTKDAGDLLEDESDRIGGRVSGGYNSNAQLSFSGTLYGRVSDRVDVLAYYNYIDRDNFEDGEGVETIGSDGTTQDLMLKVGVDLTENQRFEVSFDQLSDEGDYTQRPDMGVRTNAAITGDILLPTEYERKTINATYSLDLEENLQLSATFYMNDMSLWRDETNPAIPRSAGTFKQADADNYGAYILANSTFESGPVVHSLNYGLEYFDQNLEYVSDVAGGVPAIKEDAKSLAIFLENEMTISERFIIRPGLRYNDYKVNYEELDSEGSWDELTFGIAGEVKVVDGLSLLASYTTLFRGPELAEVFTGSGANRVVNPDVEAETGDNIEVGFRYSTTIENVELYTGANFFWTNIDDYIASVSVPGSATGDVWDANIGTAKINGFEASAGLVFNGLDVLLTYSSSELDNEGLDTSLLGENLREVGDTLGFDVTYEVPDLQLTLNYNLDAVFELTDALGTVKEGYTIHNISARWENPLSMEGMTLTFGVDNLFDKQYTSHASRYGATTHPVFGPLVLNDVEPGRNIKVTLAQRF